MAGDFSTAELKLKGEKLGVLLEDGHAAQAKTDYDALILRIQDESAKAPDAQKITADRIDAVHQGMSIQDPDDVKGPGKGTSEGYYIYWNTENLVNQTFSSLDTFCQNTKRCDVESGQGLAAAPLAYTDSQLRAAMMQKDGAVEKMLSATNAWLDKAMPDQLEHHTFVADFNRRKKGNDWLATIDFDTLAVKIIEQP